MVDPEIALGLKSFAKWAKKHKIYLPATPEEMANLKELNLKMKEIKKLPKEIVCFRQLERLDLSYNELEKLPEGFGTMIKLNVLRLDMNRFERFPSEITRLTALEELHFESNNLTAIPSSISEMLSLRHANFFYNQITEIPVEIGKNVQLVTLNVAANRIHTLPESIARLENLEELVLWSNPIKELPEWLKSMPKLKQIELIISATQLNEKLLQAARKNNIGLAKELIEKGADVNYRGEDLEGYEFTTPLFESVSAEMVHLLITKGADVNLRRALPKKQSIKIWESDQADNESESFLNRPHSVEVRKMLKKLKIIK